MTAFEPYAGARKGIAWDAAAEHFQADTWVARDALLDAMVAASEMQRSSCEAVLNEARKAGWLRQDAQLRLRPSDAGKTLRRELRLASS